MGYTKKICYNFLSRGKLQHNDKFLTTDFYSPNKVSSLKYNIINLWIKIIKKHLSSKMIISFIKCDMNQSERKKK